MHNRPAGGAAPSHGLQPAYALADDLTGALEVGAKLAAAGLPADVTTRHCWDEGPVIDTETRHVAAQEAGAIVQRLAWEARDRGARLIYKKTDSTLRGNIGAELSALAAAFPGSRVAYLPAYPRMGRTVKNGHLLVNGTPVHLTDFARDPLNPVRESHIPTLIASPCVEVWDGETEEDIERAAERLLQSAGTLLAAGPAAFAEAIARRLGEPLAALPRVSGVRRVLVINGSLHPVSKRQVAAMPSDSEWTVWTEAGPGIGRKVREVAERFEALIIFGGDTAFEVLAALGCTALRPMGEITVGVPVSMIRYGGCDLVLITKAGGFGPDDILEVIRSSL